jgi:hypothetical protein
MDGKAKHYARCGQNAKTKLQFTDLEIKIEKCKPKRLSWAAYNALESEEGKRVWHHNSWMLP